MGPGSLTCRAAPDGRWPPPSTSRLWRGRWPPGHCLCVIRSWSAGGGAAVPRLEPARGLLPGLAPAPSAHPRWAVGHLAGPPFCLRRTISPPVSGDCCWGGRTLRQGLMVLVMLHDLWTPAVPGRGSRCQASWPSTFTACGGGRQPWGGWVPGVYLPFLGTARYPYATLVHGVTVCVAS